MTKQIDTLLIDTELSDQQLDQIVKKLGAILRRSPTVATRVRPRNDESFLVGKVLPFLDERESVSTGSMKENNQCRWSGGLG